MEEMSLNTAYAINFWIKLSLLQMQQEKVIYPVLCYWAFRKRKRMPVQTKKRLVILKLRRLLCFVPTFNFHWWKYYPGTHRYVHCRICDKLPPGQWAQLQKMREESNG